MSIADNDQKLIVEVSELSDKKEKLINFLKNTELSLFKELITEGRPYKEVGVHYYSNLLTPGLSATEYNELADSCGYSMLEIRLKRASLLRKEYISLDTQSKFSVSSDLTCCGIAHYINFHDLYDEPLKKLCEKHDVAKPIVSYSFKDQEARFKKIIKFYKEIIFQDMFFQMLGKLIPNYLYITQGSQNSLITMKEIIRNCNERIKNDKSIRNIYATGEKSKSLQFRAVTAVQKEFMVDAETHLKRNACDTQIAAYIAFKEMPYFKQVNDFTNINSGNRCINFEANINFNDILDLVQTAEQVYLNNI